MPLVDARAAAACHQAGVGAEVELALGHGHDPRWGQPIAVRGQVLRLSDGRFRYRGGIWEGVEGQMGPAAVLALGQIQVLLASHPTYEWDGEQFCGFGDGHGASALYRRQESHELSPRLWTHGPSRFCARHAGTDAGDGAAPALCAAGAALFSVGFGYGVGDGGAARGGAIGEV